MAAEGREAEEQGLMDLDGLDIDEALFAEPEAQNKSGPTKDMSSNPEGQAPTFLRSPIRPSAEDVEKHDATHVPYRNWCPICVAARGKEDPHKRQVGARQGRRKAGLPKFSLDYQKLKSKLKKKDEKTEENKVEADDGESLKIIVGKDEPTGMLTSHRVEVKGPGDEWIIRRLVKDVEELGRGDIIIKTDGEPSMLAVQKAVAVMRKDLVTRPENPPAYNPESNGSAEKAVQDVSGQVRSLKLALEARLGVSIGDASAVMDWIVEHAAYVLSRFSVGHDGMTPYERLTGESGPVPWLSLERSFSPSSLHASSDMARRRRRRIS